MELGLCDGTYAVLLDSIAELIQEKSDPVYPKNLLLRDHFFTAICIENGER